MTLIIHAAIFLSISFLAYWFLLSVRWRSIFLVLASVYFMSLFSIEFTIYFIFNALLVYIAGTYMSKSDKNRKLYLKLSLIWLIGSLFVFKYTHVLLNSFFKLSSQFSSIPDTTFTRIALPLGTSYIVFRLIHYIVEMYRKTLPEHTFWDLSLYVFFFPTFIAGPVDRFHKFHPQTTEKKPLNPADINYGLYRIISGMIKKFVVADSLTPLILPVITSPDEYSRLFVLLAIYGSAVKLYMDFSGYTDMAIGVSRLFGYRIMENFNLPFFKKNIALFWRNWHMSVYSFIRDYFFFPFFAYRASQLKIYIGIFTTMMLFCLWHELSWPFLIIGVYTGLGMVVWQAFQEVKRKRPWLRKIVDNPYSDVLSTFLTFNYISFGFIVFDVDIHGMREIFQRIIL